MVAKKKTKTRYYKILGENGESCNGGTAAWSLPSKGGKVPGQWMPYLDNVELCVRGYHLAHFNHLRDWLRRGRYIYKAEGRGRRTSDGKKTAFAEARLLRLVGKIPNDYDWYNWRDQRKSDAQLLREVANWPRYKKINAKKKAIYQAKLRAQRRVLRKHQKAADKKYKAFCLALATLYKDFWKAHATAWRVANGIASIKDDIVIARWLRHVARVRSYRHKYLGVRRRSSIARDMIKYC